ncbi:hypothetical protein HS088_TW16G00837 [Tripterygium wilfordii]|uniref:Uncharacterized protein n=1 Tax=Tripterygium wilfordii TaxID=458696 RepID=A0A7J7CK10_TRIWF|nr:hypothetical protein HS088_TW16G00837 [Tripterygium wilfordii]
MEACSSYVAMVLVQIAYKCKRSSVLVQIAYKCKRSSEGVGYSHLQSGSLIFTFWFCTYPDQLHSMECVANSAGCGLQSLSGSFIIEHLDLLLCIIAIFFPCLDFWKKSFLMEAGVECAAPDHHILRECSIVASVVLLDDVFPVVVCFLLNFTSSVSGSSDLILSILSPNMVYQY